MIRTTFWVWLGLVSVVVAEVGPLAWDPARTSVLVVGTLEWEDAASLEPFPKTDRRDAQLVAWFKKKGVPDSRMVYLQDKQATLAVIRERLARLLEATGPGDQLVIYYCGHGYLSAKDSSELVLASYDAGIGEVEGWSLRELVQTVAERFGGERTAIFLDCCHSGGAVTAVRRHHSAGSYGVLASSTTAETSTGNWTFTEGLLRALDGDPAADVDGNGTITWSEMGRFLEREMKFAEEQQAAAHQQNGWTAGTPVAKAKAVKHRDVGAHAWVKTDGEEWKARILAVEPERMQIFYYGYEAADVEWVEPSRVRLVRD
ncbi:MAG: hypothetical protein OHK005_07340 [Candidatus Methylacidiphilales bacterium]